MDKCPYCFQPIKMTKLVRGILQGRACSVAAIKAAVREKTKATDKQVYNALGYLTRHRMIERLGYGQYEG